jgi:flagellar protein FliO/FliZ
MSFSTIALAIGALALVLGVLAITQHLAARFKLPQRLAGATGTARTLAIEQTLALDPRRRLLLIRCDGRQLLLLTGGPEDLLIGWMEPRA